MLEADDLQDRTGSKNLVHYSITLPDAIFHPHFEEEGVKKAVMLHKYVVATNNSDALRYSGIMQRIVHNKFQQLWTESETGPTLAFPELPIPQNIVAIPTTTPEQSSEQTKEEQDEEDKELEQKQQILDKKSERRIKQEEKYAHLMKREREDFISSYDNFPPPRILHPLTRDEAKKLTDFYTGILAEFENSEGSENLKKLLEISRTSEDRFELDADVFASLVNFIGHVTEAASLIVLVIILHNLLENGRVLNAARRNYTNKSSLNILAYTTPTRLPNSTLISKPWRTSLRPSISQQSARNIGSSISSTSHTGGTSMH